MQGWKQSIIFISFWNIDLENKASRKLFFLKIKQVIGSIPQLLVVFDQHKAIVRVIFVFFLDAIHGILVNHICENLKRKPIPTTICVLYDNATYSYRYVDCDYYYSQIKASDKKTTDLLEKESVKKRREHVVQVPYTI